MVLPPFHLFAVKFELKVTRRAIPGVQGTSPGAGKPCTHSHRGRGAVGGAIHRCWFPSPFVFGTHEIGSLCLAHENFKDVL